MAFTLAELTSQFPHAGQVEWIGVRPERKLPLITVDTVHIAATGLQGDHRNTAGKRAVTLIQKEHLDVIKTFSHCSDITFADLRRNIAVSGVNLLALRDRMIAIGDVNFAYYRALCAL